MSENTDEDCKYPYLQSLLFEKYIQQNIKSLAEELKLNTISSTPNKNVSVEILQTAGEMFTYLSFCPSIFIPKYIMYTAYLLQTQTPREIILGFRIIKFNKKFTKCA